MWYARRAAEHGWSQAVLRFQIDGSAHESHGKALSNFAVVLPSAESDMATQVFEDPYVFYSLGTADPWRAREVQQALVDPIQRFLLELGACFTFVGGQVHLEVGGQDFYVDLLFYPLKLRAFVAIELTSVGFEPGFVGQFNLYLSAVGDLLRHPDDKPMTGLLLCRAKERIVVE